MEEGIENGGGEQEGKQCDLAEPVIVICEEYQYHQISLVIIRLYLLRLLAGASSGVTLREERVAEREGDRERDEDRDML